MAILMKDDPYLEIPLEELDEDTAYEMIEYRENLPVDASLAEYTLNVYENALELNARKDWVSVYDTKINCSYGLLSTDFSKYPKNQLIILN